MAQSLDGFKPTATPSRPTLRPRLQPAANNPSVSVPLAVPVRPHTPSEPIQAKRTWRERLQTPVLILCCMLAGFFFQNLMVGIITIGLYAVVSFIAHINSRVTFALAFISLVSVVALLLIKQNVALASNFATYTFLLLVIGVIALSFEAQPRGRKKRRSGR